jgi:serine/threonine-protein kinase
LDGVAQLADFGIAKAAGATTHTANGVIKGKVAYMAPEQVTGSAIDRRSDIFSLGVVLYEMVAGVAPFSGEDLSQLMYQVVDTRPAAPSRINPECPDLLDFIVAKALEKNPEDRYQEASELADDLRLCRDSLPEEPISGKPAGDTLPLDAESPPPSTDMEPGSNAQVMLSEAQAPSPPRAPASAGMASHAGASLGLMPSRQSDSAKALARLTTPSASDRQLLSPAAPAGRGLGRLRQDTDLLFVVAMLGIAAAIALYIAFT